MIYEYIIGIGIFQESVINKDTSIYKVLKDTISLILVMQENPKQHNNMQITCLLRKKSPT